MKPLPHFSPLVRAGLAGRGVSMVWSMMLSENRFALFGIML
jgi:hypothetical protein